MLHYTGRGVFVGGTAAVMPSPRPDNRALLIAVKALLNFGDSEVIADSFPRIELAKRLLGEMNL
jgi:hypothetical protein